MAARQLVGVVVVAVVPGVDGTAVATFEPGVGCSFDLESDRLIGSPQKRLLSDDLDPVLISHHLIEVFRN